MGKNKYGNLEKSKFNEALNNNAGENKTKLYSVDNEYIVIFIDSNRVYSIDADGNIQVADENILVLNSYNMGIIKNISETQGAIIGTIYPVSTNVTLDNVFWYENSTDKWIGSGKDKATGEAISITKSQLISTVEDGLLKSLNDYVEIYNNQSEENKTYTNGEDLVYWIMDTENECPTLNFINRK